MNKKASITVILFLCVISSTFSQVNVRDSTARGLLFNFGLAYNFTGGDVADLYNSHMSLGFDMFYKTKSNWLFGGGLDYLFGTNVKNPDELLADFITDD